MILKFRVSLSERRCCRLLFCIWTREKGDSLGRGGWLSQRGFSGEEGIQNGQFGTCALTAWGKRREEETATEEIPNKKERKKEFDSPLPASFRRHDTSSGGKKEYIRKMHFLVRRTGGKGVSV